MLIAPFVLLGNALGACWKKIRAKIMYVDSEDEEEENPQEGDLEKSADSPRHIASFNAQNKPQQPDYEPWVGADVMLRNLTKIEYNGLRGTILKYIEEKDRWLVEVQIYMNVAQAEVKEISLKADNFRVLQPDPYARNVAHEAEREAELFDHLPGQYEGATPYDEDYYYGQAGEEGSPDYVGEGPGPSSNRSSPRKSGFGRNKIAPEEPQSSMGKMKNFFRQVKTGSSKEKVVKKKKLPVAASLYQTAPEKSYRRRQK